MEGHRAPRRPARGIPFDRIPTYPVDPDNLANRVGGVAATEGWCPEYTRATYRAWFLEDKPPGDPEHLRSVVSALGKDPEAVMELADSQEIRTMYDAETEAARGMGIFGSPTFVVADEIFWGDDRLEDALEWCNTH